MTTTKTVRTIAGPFAALALVCIPALAQQPRQYTDQDYARAEKFLAYNVNPLAYKGQVSAQWLDDDRFWYREVDDSGINYVLVDPEKGSRKPLFDQEKLAKAMKAATKGAHGTDAKHLQLTDISLSDGDRTLVFSAYGANYRCSIGGESDSCAEVSGGRSREGEHALPPMTLSPDKKLGAFVRDWNLWVRNLKTGAETQLTTDGVKDFG